MLFYKKDKRTRYFKNDDSDVPINFSWISGLATMPVALDRGSDPYPVFQQAQIRSELCGRNFNRSNPDPVLII